MLEAQIRESYGKVVYSHKVHEKAADILLSNLSWVKTSQIILSGVTTAGLIQTFFGDSNWGIAIGSIASTLLLILNSIMKNNDHAQLAERHRQAARDIWLCREKYLSLLTDLRSGHLNDDAARTTRDGLIEELHGAYEKAPSTNTAAYRKAVKAIEYNEEAVCTDDEIDRMLPAPLRKGGT